MTAHAWPTLVILLGTARTVVHASSKVHVAAASKPVEEEQLVGPDTPYPLLHVGWHVPPGARLLAHVPRPPLVGAATAHGANVGEGVGDAVAATAGP